ncbi:MAG: hypothetical protein ABJA70_17510 [Chryseolinea sp.]
MTYLIFGVIFVIIVVLILHRVNRNRLSRQLEQLRATWGEQKTGPFYFERIRKYADVIKGAGFHRLTEQTVDDIDFYGLFSIVDRTVSRIGQQFLFRKLVEPTDQVSSSSENLIELVTNNKATREDIQTELIQLSNSDAYNVSSLLEERLQQRPSWLNLLLVNLLMIVLFAVLSFSNPVFIVFLIPPVFINMLVHSWNKTNAYQFVSSFPQLNILINVSKRLLKKGDVFFSSDVEKSILNLRSFQFSTSFINLDRNAGVSGELSQVGTYVIDFIKAALLIEVFTFYKVLNDLETKRQSIITLFDFVGNIDVAISVASLRSGALPTCKPIITSQGKMMVFENVYHPLIKNCRGNSLSIKGKSVLITGSNMSGKSTFLRTLMINSICAQSIHTCFADRFVSPILKQYSSIRIDDSLFEGTSYYQQEVKTMGSLIKEASGDSQNLFVLDEVFKGTNAVERVAAAKAILSYLNRRNNIVIVATHDMELSELLYKEYDLYHFSDSIENDQLRFDHAIKPGRLRTGNAIKILELSDYPIEVIEEARRIVGGALGL